MRVRAENWKECAGTGAGAVHNFKWVRVRYVIYSLGAGAGAVPRCKGAGAAAATK